ncbi:hypothetical protein HNY73_000186 [Argiope bruennichi]|uniref:Uncharacterized protein n=1 Tax=Argiope bruennichi TaxID=94029 RepID=A0A8T0G1M2_ARGBR|nr:hypothetical protein HNY73_000186 [Argiope bruennichi]
MAFLARATREDLITLATELGETLGSKETKVNLKDVILKSVNYEEEYIKELLLAIAEERKARVEEEKVRERAETEERVRSKRLELEFEERKRKEGMKFELQKLRLQHNTSLSQTSTGSSTEPLFTPQRDGPHIVTTQRSFTSYEVADPNNPNVPLETYHSSVLHPCLESHANSQPIHRLRRRCRLKRN